MGLRAVIRPEAEGDLLQARDWYEQDGPDLAAGFVDSFEVMIARIEAMPELYAVAFQTSAVSSSENFLTWFITECGQIGSK